MLLFWGNRFCSYKEDIDMHEARYKKLEQAVTMILEAIGEDPTREGLLKRQNVLQKCIQKYLKV